MHSGSVTACTSAGRHDTEPSKRQKFSEDEDRISNLPDFIIGHILTFLDNKNAIKTSVLSWRWRYMWTFITKLSFNDSKLPVSFPREKTTWFVNYVSRVLLHLNSACIEEFSLHINEKYDSCLINQWISAVSNKKVKRIDVWSYQECDLFFCPLFKCQSLEELVLVITGGCSIKIPTFVGLSSLTVLNFAGITFTCYSSHTSKEVTLNFPVLREYKTRWCTWLDVKSLTLEAPLLKKYLSGQEHYLAGIPEFGLLRHLELHYVTGEALLGLLLKSPCLETLVCYRLLDFYGEDPFKCATVPDCFLSTLKEVEFENITDHKCELSFAKFVMENAQVLERISFGCFGELSVLLNFQKKLASVNCISNIASKQYCSVYEPPEDYYRPSEDY
ncbi:hypothetical protein TSUD_01520 [Trifolium subterraneum]|nr:hypothetical protein TSUD_01520 [Trifolium subterraneum]